MELFIKIFKIIVESYIIAGLIVFVIPYVIFFFKMLSKKFKNFKAEFLKLQNALKNDEGFYKGWKSNIEELIVSIIIYAVVILCF